ncbi:hypothetical protein S245_069652, partial [Arachis hypogaea]
ILQKCIDYEYLIDFVGVLCGLKKRRDVECNGKILKVLTLEVFADGKKISCNFVGDCPALIDMNTLKRYGIASHHFSRLRSNERIEHRYCPQFFHKLLGKEIVFKVQAKRISTQGYCGTFKIINVISDALFSTNFRLISAS